MIKLIDNMIETTGWTAYNNAVVYGLNDHYQ
jgi:hypothetical protein